MKIPLTADEKRELRIKKMKIADIADHDVDSIQQLLAITSARAQEIKGLCDFQQVPSIGIKFAEDLVSMGYFTLEELRGKDPVALIDQYETLQGYWVDACVEDQFRLVVYFSETGDTSKNWWDFTAERKAYRLKYGYNTSRPKLAWHESQAYKSVPN